MAGLLSKFNINPWLRLVRIPTVLTVPGDGILGILAAATAGQAILWNRIWVVVPILICLYWTGMILNDCFDLAENWRQGRRERPLVSGEITLNRACLTALILSFIALISGWLTEPRLLTATLILLALILFYDSIAKTRMLAGMVAMGMCRGGAVALGAVAQAPDRFFTLPVIISALGMGGYVMVVTGLAEYEEKPRKFGLEVFFPALYTGGFLILTVIGGIVSGAGPAGLALGTLIFLGLLLMMLRRSIDLYVGGVVHPPQIIQKMIGRLLRFLIVLQAALMAVFGGGAGIVAAVILLTLLLPLSIWACRFFYSS